MVKKSKRHAANLEKIEKGKRHSLDEAVDIVKNSFKPVKFDETVDITIRLGVDMKKSDQIVRGAVSLPRGIGKELNVIVFVKEDRVQEALDAGAVEAGSDDLAKKIQDGFMDFDVAIASPDVMSVVGKLGKILGPQGKMPSPKSGTVTKNIADAVKEYKAGKIEFRADSGGNVHAPMGKRSFPKDALLENINVFYHYVKSLKPATTKGQYILNVSLNTSMGPGVPVQMG